MSGKKSVKKEIATADTIKYVGFHGRALATVIDMVIGILILLPFTKIEQPEEVTEILTKYEAGMITEEQANQQLSDFMLTNISSGTATQFLIAGIIVVLFWIYRSGTPGKMIMKMKIVDANTGAKPKTIDLVLRYVGYIVSAVPLFLGFFWVAIDKRKQGWHDKMANTVVVYTGDMTPGKSILYATGAIVVLFVTMLIVARI